MSYHNSMYALNRKIYPEEIVIGAFVSSSENLMNDV